MSEATKISLAWRIVRAVRNDDDREISRIEAEHGEPLTALVDALWYEAGLSRRSRRWRDLEKPLAWTYRELTGSH